MKKRTSKSGEHVIDVLDNIETPVTPRSERPPDYQDEVPTSPNSPNSIRVCPISTAIDPEKLLRAWESMVAVQRELIRVVQRNEEDNRKTRADNSKTRILLLVVLLLVSVLMVAQTMIASMSF